MKAWLRGGLVAMGGAWALVGAGCLSVPIPQAEADPSRFYVLHPVTPLRSGAEAEGSRPPEAAGAVIALEAVEVANYLRSRPIVVRRGEHEIQFREFARWGEPLELGVARVLREELLARGAAREVKTNSVGAERMLSVRVLACEGAADGSVLFRAAWELAATGADGKRGEAGRGLFQAQGLRWDGKSEATLAAQLSVAVAGLAGEIATALRK